MKPKVNTVVFSICGLIILGVFIFAVVRSQRYDAPSRPAVTVAQLEKQLDQTTDKPAKPNNVPKTADSLPTTKPLPATGAGQAIALFAVTSVSGFMMAEVYTSVKRRSAIS